ncbi:MAG: amino acid adenylation domain-containing protein [Polyangiaceae bacterium]
MSDPKALAERRARLTPEQQAVLQRRLSGAAQPVPRSPIARLKESQRGALSFAQQRQWFLWQLNPRSSAYHLHGGLRLRGVLEVNALRAAIARLIARHEALRTVFEVGPNGSVEQVISPSFEFELPSLDLSSLDSEARAARLHAERDVLGTTPFDLKQGPLLRALLVKTAPDEQQLLVVLHHIIADAWSVEVILGELALEYRGHVLGRPAMLPELPIRYLDYAAWQRRWLSDGEAERQLAYWRAHLGSSDPALQLATDHPRQATADQLAATHSFAIEPELLGRVRRHAQEHGGTLFMSLLTAFQVVLHRHSAQTAVRLGVLNAGRSRDESLGVVGFFVNTQVLRTELSGRSTLSEVWARAKEAALGAQAHPDLPFEQLVEALQPERRLDENPLFQVMFNHLKRRPELLSGWPGLAVERFDWGHPAAQLELTLETLEQENGEVEATLRYAADRFDARTMERLARHFCAALRALVTDSQQAVAEIELVDAADAAKLSEWGTNAERHASAATFATLFERQVERRGAAIAVRCAGVELTYTELNRRANRLAHRLRELGIAPEIRVGIALERSLELLVALLATVKVGGVYVPLDPEYPAQRLDQMMANSGIALLLTQSRLRERLSTPPHLQRLELDQLDMREGVDSNLEPGISPENLAYVIYTSGSTGRPKGVMVRHGALSHFLLSMQQHPGLTEQDALLAVTSLSFDIAALELFLPLISGARVVLATRDQARDGRALSSLVAEEGITVLQATPATWRLLNLANLTTASSDSAPAPLKALCGGEALPLDLAESLARAGIELWNMYGPTETTIWSSANRVERAPSIAGPISDTRLLVLDSELNQVPIGVPGELYIGGIGLARGYSQQAGLTAQRFVADPFDRTGAGRLYRTGDWVRFRDDARLEYLNRVDQQVKIRGFRIELGEIESQLLALPGVREAVAVVRQPGAGARLFAFVTARPATALDSAILRERLSVALPEYMVPTIVVLEALPLTPNGKVDRKALPEPEQASALEREPPRGTLETTLARIWSALLGVSTIGRNDSFFELGGHSLSALQLTARLRAELGVDLPLRRVFEQPRLSAMARQLDLESAVVSEGALRLQSSSLRGYPVLSPVQRRLWLVERLASSGTEPRAAYNMTTALRLSGSLAVGRLRSALNAIVSRHEPLRTAYTESDDGDPIVVALEPLPVELPVHVLPQVPAPELEELVQRAFDALSDAPFDLAKGPVLRAQLLELGALHHVLLLSVHHIAFDGWSESIFARELVAFYASETEGGEGLPPLTIQYSDYAAWQSRKLQRDQAQHAEFWRSYLKKAPALSRPTPDRTAIASGTDTAATITLDIPVRELAPLKGLALSSGTTVFNALLSAFLLLLHRELGSEDLVIGTDSAGRSEVRLEDLIGFFVNVVPVRSRLSEAATLSEWLAHVRDQTLSALEHQDVPFDQIVEHTHATGRREHSPLLQVLFVMQNVPKARFELPGLEIAVLPQQVRASKFDLAVFVTEGEQGLRADWVYSRSLYRPETVERLATAWRQLLEQFSATPSIALDQLVVAKPKDPSMSSLPTSKSKLDKLSRVLGRQGPSTPATPIRASFLSPAREFPLVIEATSRDLDPTAWAREQRAFIEASLGKYGAVLFRSFALDTAQEFETFAEVIEPELFGSYGDLPKKEGGRKTYQSTPYPEQQMILFHNESSHLSRWPRKQWFFCELPSIVGGATPIVDCREMLRSLPTALVHEFESKGLLYVRTFHPRLDVNWQAFFKTEERAEVESKLARAGVEWRWFEDDTLQTRTRCPAVIAHPVTGERSFFNQVQLHHVSCLEPEVRRDLLETVGLELLPRQVHFGDGSLIDDETMAIIGQTYEACAVRFAWKRGDVVMLDNMLAAHARDPYEGPRKIVVAMGAMFERDEIGRAKQASDAVPGQVAP